MTQRRTVYALSSSADGVVVYVGSTSVRLSDRLRQHLTMSSRSDAPVHTWIRATRSAGQRVVIRQLIRGVSVEAERAEIARRVALGEPLLNVNDGGPCEQTRRAAADCRVDGEHHSSVADGALPAWAEKAGSRVDAVPENSREWLVVQRQIQSASKPIRPREPRHINAWRDTRAALAPPPQLADVAA